LAEHRRKQSARLERGDGAGDAEIPFGLRADVPAQREAAQFRYAKNTLHAGRGRQAHWRFRRDGRPLRRRWGEISGRDLVGCGANYEASA
jgi:hypothetical protein